MIITNELHSPLASGDRFAGAGKPMDWIVPRLLTRAYGALAVPGRLTFREASPRAARFTPDNP